MTKLSAEQLQTKLLELMEEGTRLYWRSAGRTPPELFLQGFVAAGLIEAGFCVLLECTANEVCSRFKIEKTENFVIDMLVWDSGENGDPEEPGPVRAAVELKICPGHIGPDVERTARLLATTGKANPQMFGFVICGGYMHKDPGQPQIEMDSSREQADGLGSFQDRVFDEIMRGKNQGHLYGAVTGVVVTPAASSERIAA